jgi:hypothetical protein
MSETEDAGEQLSEEEIAAEVQNLLVSLRPFNNLKASVLENQHYGMRMIESDPDMLEGDDEQSKEFRVMAQKWKDLSLDLREAMVEVGLKAEDGYAYRDINNRSERRMADLIFLRDYLPKMEALYKRLHYKNGIDGEIRWDQQTLGTIFEEDNE